MKDDILLFLYKELKREFHKKDWKIYWSELYGLIIHNNYRRYVSIIYKQGHIDLVGVKSRLLTSV